ncbi:DUF2771 domain-containing protein [Nocardia sp. NPDC003482]|uniref:DUF2771 domain-containing protein n=1 Tax=Nocardia sp. NPDC004068 TaxID=3364303 RepID=UPI0036BAFE88
MKPKTRLALALSAAGVLVVLVAVAAVVIVAVRHAGDKEPTVTAYAHGRTVTVAPYRYCTVTRSDADGGLGLNCRPESAESVALETPPGYPVQLSLPLEIAQAPWAIRATYLRPDGTPEPRLLTYRDYPAETRAVTVNSLPEPGLRLGGLEVELLVPVRDQAGNEGLAPYQAWSIKTA